MFSNTIALSSAVCLFSLIAATPAFAFCNPNPNTGLTCLDNATDSTCSTLGATTMDGDKQNIIACLGTSATANDCSAGQCKWKAMTSASESIVPKIKFYSAASKDNGTEITLGSHSFCALTRSHNRWETQAGGCQIGRSSGIYTLTAVADPDVHDGEGIHCSAICLDF